MARGWTKAMRGLPMIVLIVGLIVFAALAVACWVLYDQSEQSLLEERTGEASAVLDVGVSQIRAPLDAAATLAAVTDGDPAFFGQALDAQVGDAGVFSSAALYELGSAVPVAAIGTPLELPAAGTVSVDSLVASAATEAFIVVDLLDHDRRLGYAVVDDPTNPTYLVYAERQLSADPNVRRRTDEPFAELDYAIYLNEEDDAHLLGSSRRDLPIDGRRAAVSSDFGDQQLLLVMTPTGQLGSALFANLWWIVAAAGALLSIVAAAITRQLLRRREQAIALAADNARLYDEQRHIAETLQLSLLPQQLTPPPGAEVAARYWPAQSANLIGGDFYDAFAVDDRRWAVAIGDVCGKGIEAAAITGLVRHTLRAAARTSCRSSDVLEHVHRALLDHTPPTFCTVCFFYVVVDGDGQHVELCLGGHPHPLLRTADGEIREIGTPGTLLGMPTPTLTDVCVPVQTGDTILLYTDGLTDAPRDEAVPLADLTDLMLSDGSREVGELADAVRPLKRRRRPRGSSDDTAILVLRFGQVPTPHR